MTDLLMPAPFITTPDAPSPTFLSKVKALYSGGRVMRQEVVVMGYDLSLTSVPQIDATSTSTVDTT